VQPLYLFMEQKHHFVKYRLVIYLTMEQKNWELYRLGVSHYFFESYQKSKFATTEKLNEEPLSGVYIGVKTITPRSYC
jgi:hypothetical protein